MKIFGTVLLILAGILGVTQLISRLLFKLWVDHEIEILSERMRQDVEN